MLEVSKKLEAAGYTNVYKMEFEHGRYKAKAISNGKKVELYIDPQTGKISNDWVGD